MKNRRKIYLIVITILVIFTLNAIEVFAATRAELENKQQKTQQEIKEAKEEQEKIRSEMSEISKEVEDLNFQIANYENDIIDLSTKIEETEQNIKDKEIEITSIEKSLEEKEELLAKRLVASYKAGSTSYLDILLGSHSLTDFLSNYYLIEQLTSADNKLIGTIRDTKTTVEEAKVSLEESKTSLEEAKKEQVAKKDSLDTIKQDKSSKVASLSAEEKELQEEIEEMQAEDAAIKAAIRAAQNQQKPKPQPAVTINPGSGNSTPAQPTTPETPAPTTNPGGYIYPLPAGYCQVTTGMYYSETGIFKGAYHGAWDFGCGGIYGQPVYAVKSGTVILTKEITTGYGTYVMIDHHDGTFTLYAHGIPGSICVSTGQSVSQGQTIMKVGSSGKSTGPHLHFEVRVSPGNSNDRVNPGNYLY